MATIKEKVILTKIKITGWSGSVRDHKAESAVNNEFKADAAGHFYKKIIECPELDAIDKHTAYCYKWVKDNTLPWSDGGERMLAAASYVPFKTKLLNEESEHARLVNLFMDVYINTKINAERKLGGLFTESDYPSIPEVKAKFGFFYRFLPIADAGDVRVNIEKDELDRLRADVKAELAEQAESAINTLLARIKTTVRRYKVAVKAKKPDFDKVTECLEEMKSLAVAVPALNFNNDKLVADIAKALPTLIIDIKDLTEKAEERAAIAVRAQAVIEMFPVKEDDTELPAGDK